MTIHSSILAWRTPWTEEPGGLQLTGSQRVGFSNWYYYWPGFWRSSAWQLLNLRLRLRATGSGSDFLLRLKSGRQLRTWSSQVSTRTGGPASKLTPAVVRGPWFFTGFDRLLWPFDHLMFLAIYLQLGAGFDQMDWFERVTERKKRGEAVRERKTDRRQTDILSDQSRASLEAVCWSQL